MREFDLSFHRFDYPQALFLGHFHKIWICRTETRFFSKTGPLGPIKGRFSSKMRGKSHSNLIHKRKTLPEKQNGVKMLKAKNYKTRVATAKKLDLLGNQGTEMN